MEMWLFRNAFHENFQAESTNKIKFKKKVIVDRVVIKALSVLSAITSRFIPVKY